MARTKKLDFTGVESYTKASEGIHTAKVAEIQEKTSQGGDDMLQFAFEIIKGEDKGCKVFESFSLTDKALWKLKSCLQALGMKADGKMKLDLDKLIGKICDIEVFWDDYNGQTRAKISDFYKAGKGAASAADEDDEDVDDEADDEDEDEDEAPAPKKAPAKGKKAPAAKGKKKPEPEPEDDDEDEDEDEEEEEEEEPAPKKGKKASKAPAKPAKGKPAKGKKKPVEDEEEDEDEDEDDDEDDEWEEDDD